jgi:hypothetical protein
MIIASTMTNIVPDFQFSPREFREIYTINSLEFSIVAIQQQKDWIWVSSVRDRKILVCGFKFRIWNLGFEIWVLRFEDLSFIKRNI